MSETTELLDTPQTGSRGTGLAGMVLPELRSLAGQLGIKGTSGMRKGDLIAAIRDKQSSSAAPTAAAKGGAGKPPVAATERAATNGTNGHAPADAGQLTLPTPVESAPAATSAPAEHTGRVPAEVNGAAPVDRQPRPATDAADRGGDTGGGDAPGETGDQSRDGQPQGGGEDGQYGQRTNRRNRRNRRDRNDRSDQAGGEPNDAAERPQGQGQGQPQQAGTQAPATQGGGSQGGGQNAGNQGGNQGGGQNAGNQGGGNQGGNQNRNQGGNQNRNDNRDNNRDNDDDGDGSRRGRRYRDRNRRNRERFTEGPTDIEVREDDVLLPVAGILDVLDSYAFVRTSGYLTGSNDVYVSLSQVRKYGLRRGDAVTGAVRAPREGEQQQTRQKFNALVRLDSVNGLDPDQARNRPEFTKLTPLYPNERLRLETDSNILTTRVIDLVMPVGKGQRALIVSPPKAGKTSVLQAIANAIAKNNPEVHLMVVLVDERPEEVTDMQRSVKGEVIASTFDRPPSDHTQLAELAIERAKRLVEMGRDVVVLLDSITRLGRAYNLAAPASGRILSGGVDSTALFPPKRFLGAARNIENGGSLTIFASALVETGSAGDTVIFEEFKGTGNAELKLDRRLADKRIFPAIDIDQSSTRKEDLLMSPDEHAVVIKLRRVLAALDAQQSLELVLDRLRKTRSNIEFLMQVAANSTGAERD